MSSMGFLFRVVRRVLLLLALSCAAYAGWRWGPSVVSVVQGWSGTAPTSTVSEAGLSPELADSVLGRFQEFRRGDHGRIALGGREITSVLRYSVPGLIPSGVRDVTVGLEEGRVLLAAQVVLSSFPRLPDLGPVLGILPDTLNVVMHASLLPLSEEEAALLVQGLEASRIPIPRALIPEILRAIGRVDRPNLPPEALAVPLPAGLGSAYILNDSLILSSGN